MPDLSIFILAHKLIKIDFWGWKFLERSCDIHCIGSLIIGANWKNNVRINRLYYINGGKGGYIKNGEKVPFEHNKLYFIPFYSNIPTYTDLEDNLDHTYANFLLTPPIISTNVFCIDENKSPTVKLAIDTFCTLCKKRNLTAAEKGFLKSTILYLCDTAAQEQSTHLINDKTIVTALDVMHSTLPKKYTVADLASLCYMTTDGFIRKFKRYIGETPYSYLKRLKIRTALNMKADGATLTEIAETCGYSDPSALLHAINSSENNTNLL